MSDPHPGELAAMNNSWSAGMLASRLYSENAATKSNIRMRTTLLSQARGTSTLRPKANNLVASSSTPALRLTQSERSNSPKRPTLSKTINANAKLSTTKTPVLSKSSNKMFDISMNLEDESLVEAAEKNALSIPVPSNSDSVTDVSHRTFLESLNLSEKQMDDLLNVPNTFYYLCLQKKSDTKFYDLEVVTQDKVDPNHYYTISKEGVTQYRMKQSQFTTRVQWEREFRLFHKISNIRFFRQYRSWKVNRRHVTRASGLRP